MNCFRKENEVLVRVLKPVWDGVPDGRPGVQPGREHGPLASRQQDLHVRPQESQVRDPAHRSELSQTDLFETDTLFEYISRFSCQAVKPVRTTNCCLINCGQVFFVFFVANR